MNVDFRLLCANCNSLRTFSITLPPLPPDLILSIDFFAANVLSQISVSCTFCGANGFAGDTSKFRLEETIGLELDLQPLVSRSEKMKWFSDLDISIKSYLHLFFEINEFENVGWSLEFYKATFKIEPYKDMSNNGVNFYYCTILGVIFQNGIEKEAKNKLTVVLISDAKLILNNSFLVQLDDYNFSEKGAKTPTGTAYFLTMKKKTS